MKSAVFYGKHDIRVEEYDMPVVKENDVVIQVKACGICGTDVHIFEGDKGAATVTLPTILGHEFSGVITKIGKNVTRYKIGDRVCVDPNNYCGSCDYCREGIAHFCEHMIGYGTTMNGGFAQYCSVHEKQVYLLGENTSFEQGAMAEPVACCLHGIDMCEIQPGHHVLVIGGGMIGLLMVQLAKLAGASKVVLIEPVQGKREVAKKIGADYCINPITENVKNKLIEFGIKRVNTVIECVGNPKTINQAIELAGNKSVVMMFGLTKPDEEIHVKPFEIFQKEIVLKSSFINPYTQKRALELIDTKEIDVSCMIYEVAPLDRLTEILGSVELRRNGKYIINPET
jgi:2-desacetyl-2-hydroxyethyl bacteriochlorophyllide A dehydrogenase